MLVLTRKQGQTIQIGRDITLMVVRIRDGKVRLGIEAPRHVGIARAEIACDEGMIARERDRMDWEDNQ